MQPERANGRSPQGGGVEGRSSSYLDPHASHTSALLHALGWFVGKWQVRGYNEPITLEGRRLEVTGFQEYAWVPGKFFLNGSWDHRFGDGSHRGVCVLGYDPQLSAHFAHQYDSLGYARKYQLELAGRSWSFKGEWERASFVFDGDGVRYRELWELRKDGEAWRPLCVLEASRLA
jgi:hypothetical protein